MDSAEASESGELSLQGGCEECREVLGSSGGNSELQLPKQHRRGHLERSESVP